MANHLLIFVYSAGSPCAGWFIHCEVEGYLATPVLAGSSVPNLQPKKANYSPSL
jgi:hypothetical protein